MKYSFLLTAVFSFSLFCFGQDRLADEKAINAQIDAFINSWNQHNFSDINNYTTEDIEFINPVGMVWKGRKEVQYALQSFHKGLFQNTDMKKLSSHLRFINNDVAIAYVTDHVGAATDPNGKPMGNTDDISTYVFVKKNGTWKITTGQVVEVNLTVAATNPVSNMNKQ